MVEILFKEPCFQPELAQQTNVSDRKVKLASEFGLPRR